MSPGKHPISDTSFASKWLGKPRHRTGKRLCWSSFDKAVGTGPGVSTQPNTDSAFSPAPQGLLCRGEGGAGFKGS